MDFNDTMDEDDTRDEDDTMDEDDTTDLDDTTDEDDTCSKVGLAARAGDLKVLRDLINNGNPVDVADNNGWRPLHDAASNPDDLDCLRELLKHEKTDVNWRTHEGETALILACQYRLQINDITALCAIMSLIESGADPNICDNDDETPLSIAVMKKNLPAVEYLLNTGFVKTDVGNCDKWYPLHAAARNGHANILSQLLKANAQIDVRNKIGMTPIHIAAQFGQEECILELLKVAEERGQKDIVNIGASDHGTPLMVAAELGYVAIVRILLDYGANPNLFTTDYVTAVHLAIQENHADCLKVLLAKMNLKPLIESYHPSQLIKPSFSGIQSVNPLYLAVDRQRYECLKHLLKAGFPADTICERPQQSFNHFTSVGVPLYETALSYAVMKGDWKAMQILIEAGATCNTPSEKVFHPLMRAIFNLSTKEIIDFLIENGSDVNYHPQSIPSNEIILAAMTNQALLEHLLKRGSDPSLCFQSKFSVSLLIESLFQMPTPKIITVILQILLRYLIISGAVQNAFRAIIIRMGRNYVEDQWDSILKILDKPSSLQQICRMKLRQYLYHIHGSSFKNAIENLALPSIIRDYVLFNTF